jgi:tetratricopeptide (TPR) repeat protein
MIVQCIDRTEQAVALATSAAQENCKALLWRIRHQLQSSEDYDSRTTDELLQAAERRCAPSNELQLLKAYHEAWSCERRNIDCERMKLAGTLARKAKFNDPTDARAPALLGLIAIWEGKLDTAIRHLKHSIALNSGFALAHSLHGSALYLSLKFKEAAASLQEAIFLSPMDPHRFIMLTEMSFLQVIIGDFEAARGFVEEALAINPEYPLALLVDRVISNDDACSPPFQKGISWSNIDIDLESIDPQKITLLGTSLDAPVLSVNE